MTWKESLAEAEQKLIAAGVEDVRTNVEYLAVHAHVAHGPLRIAFQT